MRHKTAKLINKFSSKMKSKCRPMKAMWNACPRNVRHKLRAEMEGVVNA